MYAPQVFADSEESILFEEEDGDLWVRILFSDKSRRSAVQSDLNIRLWEDVNYPKSPANWIEKFNKTVAEGSGVNVDTNRTFTKQNYVKLPVVYSIELNQSIGLNSRYLYKLV